MVYILIHRWHFIGQNTFSLMFLHNFHPSAPLYSVVSSKCPYCLVWQGLPRPKRWWGDVPASWAGRVCRGVSSAAGTASPGSRSCGRAPPAETPGRGAETAKQNVRWKNIYIYICRGDVHKQADTHTYRWQVWRVLRQYGLQPLHDKNGPVK